MGPLAGLRIIEIASLGPGPFCGMMLADHGAEVIRVGRTATPHTPVIQQDKDVLNRSRKRLNVNLKAPRGIDLVRRLCRSADGLIEGFRPGVMERLGLGPELLLIDNPRLVYGRMTGWGQTGPYAQSAGHDINYIALSGALHAIGRCGDKPVPPLNLVGDFGGGGMMLAFGMLAAILQARQTGEGQVIDCAMTEGSALLMAMMYSMSGNGDWVEQRGANVLDGGAHYYDTYETADAKFIAIGPVEPHFYELLLDLLELADDPELRTQNDPAGWPRQRMRLAELFKTRSRDEWCALLEGTDACFSPVMAMSEAPRHAHNATRESFVEVEGLTQPAPAPRYSRTPCGAPTPSSGGASVAFDLLTQLGYAGEDITDLLSSGTID